MSDVIEAPRARISGDAEILTAVREADCNLAIWERPGIDADLVGMAESGCRIRFSTDLARLPARLVEAMVVAGFGRSAAHETLIEDVVGLAQLFASVSRRDRLAIRLEQVTTDSCRKFHGDYVPLRLITTYHGAATQWLDHTDAERVLSGQEPLQIRSMRAGDVGLFKGRLATSMPAIHRSPPLSDAGGSRLLLVIDPADEA